DGLAALDRRDVEALDPPRQRRQAEHVLQGFERVVLRGARLVEARLIRQPRVAVRQVDEAALLAALRDENLHAAPGAVAQPALQRVALVGLGGHVDLRRRAADLVELLHRRDQHFAFARPDDRDILISGPQLHALDDAAAADLEDLDDDAGGPELDA